MLRRIALRDFVIVASLDLDLHDGFTALTGETGAGKSILIDALQLALGQRADALVVREGAARADISAEFDAPASLQAWLVEAGFAEADEPADGLLCRRIVDAQGKSRAWINGHPATLAQLRAAADHLVDIHGQHAWQSLTRPDAVRGLLDGHASIDTGALHAAWSAWRDADTRLADARTRQSGLEAERERLQWQIAEVDKLAPRPGEWPELNAEQRRLSHAQAILDAIGRARACLSEADGEAAAPADAQLAEAIDALDAVVEHDAALREPLDILRSAQAQLQDAAHTLATRLRDDGPDPERLRTLDDRLADWMGLARRFRRPPDELPALLAQWRAELATLDAATDLDALEREEQRRRKLFDTAARGVSAARRAAAPKLAAAVTQAMQQLGMAGGRFEIALEPLAEPQRHGLEAIEFRVAGHAGSTPRALAKVASGGELSRIALAIAVTASQARTASAADPDTAVAATLIFDEIDAGVGGQVADAVGRLMRRLGQQRQVLCVTHLPQVAACADHHCVVRKATAAGRTTSDVQPLADDERAAEIARMLGGERAADTSLAHARALIDTAAHAGETAGFAKPERRKHRA